MEKTKVITLDEEFVSKLEAADYAYTTKRDVVTTYVSSGLDTSNPAFIKYQSDMETAYAAFNRLKAEVETKYVFNEYKDVTVNWNVNYATKELTINVIA